MALPKFVVLKLNQNKKYLRYIHEDEEKKNAGVSLPAAGVLSFSAEDPWSTDAKFEVKMARNSGSDGLVHIRCCNNNKYLATQQNHYSKDSSYESEKWIVAGADKRVEDQSMPSCTLFEPVFEYNRTISYTVLRLRHVELGNYVLSSKNPTTVGRLGVGSGASPDEGLLDLFTVIDWASLVRLPKYVVFQSSGNGMFVTHQWTNGSPYIVMTGTESDHSTVVNVVFTESDGSVRIMSNSLGKFWSVDMVEWIVADSDDTSSSKTRFWPIKVGVTDHVALLNMYNKKFCSRYTHYGYGVTSGMNANSLGIGGEQQLLMTRLELASTQVLNVYFRMSDARIFDKKVVEIASEEAVNSKEESQTVEVKFEYTKSWTRTWNSSISSTIKLNVKGSSHPGFPVIGDGGKMEIESAELMPQEEGGVSDDVTVTSSSSLKKRTVCVYKVVIPAKTMVKVRLLATEAWCDVPFSYTERNITIKGKMIISNMKDGVYTGFNSYDFKLENTQQKLP